MKNIFLVIFLLGSLSTHAKALKCVSYQVLNGWNGNETQQRLIVEGKVLSNTKIKALHVSGAYTTDPKNVEINKTYKPSNPKYAYLNQFQTLEDSWNYFIFLAPKNLIELSLNHKFTAYMKIVSEQGYSGVVGLFCVLK